MHDPGYINTIYLTTICVDRQTHKPSNVARTVKKHPNPTRHSLGMLGTAAFPLLSFFPMMYNK